jgi:hypothetical protein
MGIAQFICHFNPMVLIPILDAIFNFVPGSNNEIWLYAVSAIIAAYFGWSAPAPAVTRTKM